MQYSTTKQTIINTYIIGDGSKVNQPIRGLDLGLAGIDPFVHRQQQICIHRFQLLLDNLVRVADKQCTDGLVVGHVQRGSAVVQHSDIAVHTGTAPQNAVTPGRRAELLVRAGVV